MFLGTKHSDKEDSYSSDTKCQRSSVLLLRRTDILGVFSFQPFRKDIILNEEALQSEFMTMHIIDDFRMQYPIPVAILGCNI